MRSKAVPEPGYITTKPLLAPIDSMFSDLGRQDACIQLQELSIRHLIDTVQGTGNPVGEFLKPLYASYGIPHGTYELDELKELVAKSYLVLTYSQLEKMLRGVIGHYKSANPALVSTWVVKNFKDERYSALQELHANLPGAASKRLKDCPEFALLEYYRVVRVANSHVKDATLSRADTEFTRLTTKQRDHYASCYSLAAPNSPSQISFEDFRLFTRAIKYFARLINEECA
jgi:hypothetical protein